MPLALLGTLAFPCYGCLQASAPKTRSWATRSKLLTRWDEYKEGTAGTCLKNNEIS